MIVICFFGTTFSSGQLEFARPALWDEVARSFPKLHLVMCQLGHPWVDETLVLLGKHENVFGEISGIASRPWQLYGTLLNALSFGVLDKLLFGSGFPREQPTKVIEALYSVNAYSHGTQLPSIPRAQVRAIVERESLACLGIDAEITPMTQSSDETEEAITMRPMRPSIEAPAESSQDQPPATAS